VLENKTNYARNHFFVVFVSLEASNCHAQGLYVFSVNENKAVSDWNTVQFTSFCPMHFFCLSCLKRENLNQSDHIAGLINSKTELKVASFQETVLDGAW